MFIHIIKIKIHSSCEIEYVVETLYTTLVYIDYVETPKHFWIGRNHMVSILAFDQLGMTRPSPVLSRPAVTMVEEANQRSTSI